jgi:hypothetical protein
MKNTVRYYSQIQMRASLFFLILFITVTIKQIFIPSIGNSRLLFPEELLHSGDLSDPFIKMKVDIINYCMDLRDDYDICGRL